VSFVKAWNLCGATCVRRLVQSFGNILRQVLAAIWSNRLRSFLTMFGIAWGVASLLLLIGLGEGFRSGQRKSLAQVGSDFIWMWGGTVPAVGNQHTGMHPYQLTLGDAAAIHTDAPHVRNSTAILSRSDLKEVSEFSSASGGAWGVQPNYPQIGHLPIVAGRFLDEQDEAQRRHVVVLGQKNNQLLFEERRSVGSFITINGSRFEVIGVADRVGRGNDNGNNQKVYIPLSTMMELFPVQGDNIAQDALSSIQYQPVSDDQSETAKAEVHRIVADRHGFDASNKDAFEEWDSIKTNQMISLIFLGMDVFLGGVGVVTLGLGAVGIVNIMLVTVSERTKEIGLRKALGATNRNIMTQFFIEGLTLTGISGLIGIGGAAGLMALLNAAAGGKMQGFDPPQLVPWSAALAVGTLSVCGVVAGMYPARQAAMLEPVEALRKD
jgi:putative ABC transport system permease protein